VTAPRLLGAPRQSRKSITNAPESVNRLGSIQGSISASPRVTVMAQPARCLASALGAQQRSGR
jgi:hypothetical protein